MTALPAADTDPRPSASAAPSAWTCPFCTLLCEPGEVPTGSPPRLTANTCPRALAAMEALDSGAGPAALVDGQPSLWQAAADAAALRLASWRQPLFGGLGTDIAGARALYRLAARTGAICDHADGEVLMQGVRAVQDRGQFITTVGEVRSRADLIVFIGTPGSLRHPELFRRFGLGDADSPCRALVFLGTTAPSDVPAGVPVETLGGTGDLEADLQQLSALVDGRRVPGADPGLADLAKRLLAARYGVLVWEGARLPTEAALAIELIGRTVSTLNHSTRAASFGLGGNDGAFSVNQTLTWLGGLPLRTRIAADGMRHEPRSFAATRLMDRGAVDGLLWISSFDAHRRPPDTPLPRIVLGPPSMAAALGDAANTVFIAVATPGWDAGGHLFRIDGPVVVPLFPARQSGLPGVAEVLGGLAQRLEGTR